MTRTHFKAIVHYRLESNLNESRFWMPIRHGPIKDGERASVEPNLSVGGLLENSPVNSVVHRLDSRTRTEANQRLSDESVDGSHPADGTQFIVYHQQSCDCAKMGL